MLLKTPLQIVWSLTRRCNLGCIFCVASAIPEQKPEQINREQMEYVLDEIIKCRTLKVVLSGGEPLLVDDWLSYLRRLREKSIFVELTTNATLINDDIAAELRDTHVNEVQISLNGSCADINDPLEGEGSYTRILAGTDCLLAHGLPVHAKLTVIRQNIHDMPALIERLTRLGITRVEVCEVLPMGRAFSNWKRIAPDAKDLAELRHHIETIKSDHPGVFLRSMSLQFAEQGRCGGCTVGFANNSACSVTPEGNVVPCAAAEAFGLENSIFDGGLEAAWQRLEQYQQFLDPEKLKGKCGVCIHKQLCYGGCRGLTYLFTNDLWAECSFCTHEVNTDGVPPESEIVAQS